MKNLTNLFLFSVLCVFSLPNGIFGQTPTWEMTPSGRGSNTVQIQYAGFPALTRAADIPPYYEVFEIYGSGDYAKRQLNSDLATVSDGVWSWPILDYMPSYTYPNEERTYNPVTYFVSRKGLPPPGIVFSPTRIQPRGSLEIPLGGTTPTDYAQLPPILPNNTILIDKSYHIKRGLKTVFAISYNPGSADKGRVYFFYNRKKGGASGLRNYFDISDEHLPHYSAGRRMLNGPSGSGKPFENSVYYDFENWENHSGGEGKTLRHFLELNNINGVDGDEYQFMAVLVRENAKEVATLNTADPYFEELLRPYLRDVGSEWYIDGQGQFKVIDFRVINMKSGDPKDPNSLDPITICNCGKGKSRVTFRYTYCSEGPGVANNAYFSFSNLDGDIYSDFELISPAPSEVSPFAGNNFGPWKFAIDFKHGLAPLACGTIEFSVCTNKMSYRDYEPSVIGARIKGCTTFNGEGSPVCVENMKDTVDWCQSPPKNCCGRKNKYGRWWWYMAGIGGSAFLIYLIWQRRKRKEEI